MRSWHRELLCVGSDVVVPKLLAFTSVSVVGPWPATIRTLQGNMGCELETYSGYCWPATLGSATPCHAPECLAGNFCNTATDAAAGRHHPEVESGRSRSAL